MARFKIVRNTNAEQTCLLQAKLNKSLVDDINLLSKWSGNEKSYVISELLRFALSMETDFQAYKQSLSTRDAATTDGALPSSMRRDVASEKKPATTLALAK